MEVSFAGKIIELNGAFSGKPCSRTPEGNSIKSPLSPLVSMGCLWVSPLRLTGQYEQRGQYHPKAISSTGNYIHMWQFNAVHMSEAMSKFTLFGQVAHQMARSGERWPTRQCCPLGPLCTWAMLAWLVATLKLSEWTSRSTQSFPYCQYSSCFRLPSGKLSHNYVKSPFFMEKSTINQHFQ